MNDNKKDLKDLYESIGDLDKELEVEENKKRKKRNIILSILAIFIFIGLIWVLIIASKEIKDDDNTGTNKPQIVDDSNVKKNDDILIENVYINTIPEWARFNRPSNLTKNEIKNIRESYLSRGLNTSTGSMPNEKDGFTNNIDEKFKDNGFLPNPKYSAILAEDWNFFVSDAVTRFINPVYGTWSDFQFYLNREEIPSQKLYLLFDDLFTKKHFEEMRKKDPEKTLGIKADWGQNNLGIKTTKLDGLVFSWIGDIENINIDFNEDFTEGRVTADIVNKLNLGYEKDEEKKQLTFNVILENEKLKINSDLSWEVKK